MKPIIILVSFFIINYYSLIAQKNAKEYYELAEKYRIRDKMNKAYKNYYKAAELDKNYLYYIDAAEAFYFSHKMTKKENRIQVEHLYGKSMALKPWNSEGLLSIAKYWKYRFNYEIAFKYFDSLLVRDPKNIEGYLLKAEIYMNKKDTVNAFLVYNTALKNIVDNKGKASIYNHKGTYCYFKGYWEQCIEAYQQSIKANGQFNFYNNCFLSSAYYYIGEKDKACYYFELCDIDKYPSLKTKDDLIQHCKLKK